MDQMRKYFLLIILCWLAAFLSCSSQKEPLQKEIIQRGNHFLWKVSDENSSVWLLGSIHFADESFYPLDSVIETAFANAEELGVEIDVSDDSVSAEIGENSLRQGLLPDGQMLNEVLPRALWNTLDSLCSAWNFPIQSLIRYRPWFAAMMLSSVAIQRAGINPEYGIDNVLIGRAVEEGKVVVGLETVKEQVDALSGSENSDSAGIYYMKSTLREIDKLDSMVSGIVQAWKTGNDSLMQVLLNAESGECLPEDNCESDKKLKDELEDRLYNSRNVKMADAVAEFLEEDRNIFVVVGTAHLALEKNSVIEILKQRGFRIERF